MPWCPDDLERYEKEVPFQVGQFVEIDLPDVPVEDRDCTWGVIIGIRTRFPLDSHMRTVTYGIKLAGLYIKRDKWMWKGLRGRIDCSAQHLTLKED